MFSKYVPIHLKHIDDIVHWENISDFHMGNTNHVVKLAKSARKRILNDDFRFMSFGGDQLDLILPDDKRFNDASVSIRTKEGQKDAFDEFWADVFDVQYDYLRDRTPNEKIWYEQWGNHEYMRGMFSELEFRNWCQDKHGTSYLGSKGFIGLEIFFRGESKMKKTLHVNHGFGSGQVESALKQLTVNVEADVYQMGHLHQPLAIKTDTLFFNDETKEWDSKDQILVNSGCFTTGIANDKDEWFGQRNKLRTSKPGTVTISFDAYKGKMNIHG